MNPTGGDYHFRDIIVENRGSWKCFDCREQSRHRWGGRVIKRLSVLKQCAVGCVVDDVAVGAGVMSDGAGREVFGCRSCCGEECCRWRML